MAEKADKQTSKKTDEVTETSPATEAGGAPGSLSLSDIEELFVLMKANEIAELNFEQQGTKLRIVSTHAPHPMPATGAVPQLMPVMPTGLMGMPSAPAAIQ